MKFKKLLAIVISVIMMFSVCSVGVFAEENEEHTDEDALSVDVIGTADLTIEETYPPQFGSCKISDMLLYITYSDGTEETVSYTPADLEDAKITFYYYNLDTNELTEVEKDKIEVYTTDSSLNENLIYTVEYADADYQALEEKYPNAKVNSVEPTDERVLSLGIHIEIIYLSVYRLYNPNSGEHFYTSNVGEKNNLVSLGWNCEGIGWYAPYSGGDSIYRLYNPNAGDHHYTASRSEADNLVALGWRLEGIAFCSADESGIAIYRRYNSNAVAGAHFFTANSDEGNYLVTLGWHDEAVAFYGYSSPVQSVEKTPTAFSLN